MKTNLESDYEVIQSWVYNPNNSLFGDKRGKALFHVVQCNNKDKCDLYLVGQCIKLNMFKNYCPYGGRRAEEGFTKRARKFYSWISERENKYKNPKSLGSASEKMRSVGDYIYFPYPHINNYSNQSISEFQSTIIKKEILTPEMVVRILKLRPQAMFGGEITSYQKEVVPKITKHLLEIYPKIFKEVEKIYPEIKIISEYSNIGRKALLRTINTGINVKITSSEYYLWDGEYLTSDKHAPSFICKYDSVEVKVKPKKNVVVTITNDDQVNTETEFVD